MVYRMSAKELLAESFLELAEKKRIDRISIVDIIDNADVSRKTFYNNFLDKYDLIKWIHERNCKKIADDHINTHPVISCRKMFEYFEKNISFYKYLLRERQDEVYQSFYEVTMEIMGGYVLSESGKDKLTEEEEFQLSLHVHGSIHKIVEWIRSPENILKEDIARYMTLSWPMGLARYMRIKDNDITSDIIFEIKD